MGTITFFNIVLRLALWFLLTADLSLENIVIGVALALLLPLPQSDRFSSKLKDWLRVFWEIIIAIPQAFIEAIEIMLLPHNHEAIVMERVKPGRTPGLVFLDIFLITFTPKTIVMRYHEGESYEVHHVRWRKEKEIAESNPNGRKALATSSRRNLQRKLFQRKQQGNKKNLRS